MFIGGRVEAVMTPSLSSGGWKSGTRGVWLRPLPAHRELSRSYRHIQPCWGLGTQYAFQGTRVSPQK